MTNWMTAAGIALIAGGIATLICLRSVLFGRGTQRSASRGRQPAELPCAEQPRRSSESERTTSRPELPRLTDSAFTDTANLDLPMARRAGPIELDPPETPRQHRRRATRADDRPGDSASIGVSEDRPGGLASIGFAGEDEPAGAIEPIDEAEEIHEPATTGAAFIPVHRAAPAEPEREPLPVTPGDEEARPIPVRRVDRTDRAYGDRVDGWVRPEYHDDPAEVPAGEYWTPLPMDDLGIELPGDDPEPSARGYGWPIPVERLPAVPDYEPATGFDLTPVASEPTELVPTWPPMPADRPGRPVERTTRGGDRRGGRADRRTRTADRPAPPAARPDLESEFAGHPGDGTVLSERASRIRLPRTWAGRNTKPTDNRFLENEPRRATPDLTDQRFRTPTGEPERRRPRPRPRPAATTSTTDNVYVSRHAADPPL